ncbi:MAG: NADH-quinone oxidoreductase subunit NuoG [Anaerolineae bacterium]|nr:NADH-quinone oxidoreductase subunit NuoG [Anaerolineae bacterium]NUQ03459.1 NADH-quinone oxidoreductase subunit NuoG [Anaerolineae bacterium]
MTKTVTIYIDDKTYEVPAGTNLVDVAKFYADNDIPVFCYHPKMKPVGMCRMCLVEMGSVQKDRETGAVLLDDQGKPQVRWMPKLQTACTTTVSDGLVVRTNTEQVDSARENVVEFLLTSHPLDCPVCDKGGECPLQNLTMAHGSGSSRMNYADKMHLGKHVPLGDLIFLDEERCIQCARCIRFQDEVVGDPVLQFHERGRNLQIVTIGEPGFDSYFSGNTTDICPVGALTTADFRFGARPWELTNVPSICPHCPVGCNTSLSTRLDRDFGGRALIKRVMPRQNEAVNEIWICDKGRFGHHFSRSEERLMSPMLRNASGNLARTTWQEAYKLAAEKIKAAAGSVAVIAGASLTNEDLWALRRLVGESARLGAWTPAQTGADLVAQVGVGSGTNLKTLQAGDAVLVIAGDLEEEAPVWRLRLKQAADRGVYLVVANARPTRLADFAKETITYGTGEAAHVMHELRTRFPQIAEKLAAASNLIILTGAEGLTLEGSQALNQAAANFLIESGHVGKANNGLIAALPGANAMGLHYLGFTPEAAADIVSVPPKVLILAGADVADDDPNAAAWLSKVETLITIGLFLDGASERAQLALPMQSFAERDGTFTNGERRVQRFYTAQGPMGMALPAWQIAARIAEGVTGEHPKTSAGAVMLDIAKNVPAFTGARYTELAKVERQFPDVGGQDLYYGGNAYKNTGGLGVQIPAAAEGGEVKAAPVTLPPLVSASGQNLVVVPTTELYNRARDFRASEAELMTPRVPAAYVAMHAADAKRLGIADGDLVAVDAGSGRPVRSRVRLDGGAPEGTLLLPRHLTDTPVPLSITQGKVEKLRELVVEG